MKIIVKFCLILFIMYLPRCQIFERFFIAVKAETDKMRFARLAGVGNLAERFADIV